MGKLYIRKFENCVFIFTVKTKKLSRVVDKGVYLSCEICEFKLKGKCKEINRFRAFLPKGN